MNLAASDIALITQMCHGQILLNSYDQTDCCFFFTFDARN